MGKFVIKETKNGQIIATSEGYKTMKSCQNGIASVKKNAVCHWGRFSMTHKKCLQDKPAGIFHYLMMQFSLFPQERQAYGHHTDHRGHQENIRTERCRV